MAAKSSLTVLLENPFWIGWYERVDNSQDEACKIPSGAEPKDYQVQDFLPKNGHNPKFSPPVKTDGMEERKINPKRMRREMNSQLENRGSGTKAQRALKRGHKQNKIAKKVKSRVQKDAERERQFALRQGKNQDTKAGNTPLSGDADS